MKKTDWNLLNESIVWWENQRITFNIVVGISGIISMAVFIKNPLEIKDIIGVLFWGFIANILYSSGILIEVFNLYYFKGKYNFFKYKYAFYVFGSLLYCAATFICCFLYYFPLLD
jgi:hypothetical protein